MCLGGLDGLSLQWQPRWQLQAVSVSPQEALALHRPDFISRSGQRLRHLRLLREQRRLHREQLQQLQQLEQLEQLLPAQREQLEQLLPAQQLLQPPGKRKESRTATHLVSNRGTQGSALNSPCYAAGCIYFLFISRKEICFYYVFLII